MQADRNISNAMSYWIGGSSNNCCTREIPYSDYIPDDSGKSRNDLDLDFIMFH